MVEFTRDFISYSYYYQKMLSVLWKWNPVAFNLIYLLEIFKSTVPWLLHAFVL